MPEPGPVFGLQSAQSYSRPERTGSSRRNTIPRKGRGAVWRASICGWVCLLGSGACQTSDPLDRMMGQRLPKSGAVVSGQPLASAVGLHFLDRGGNAADAAVATALALAVVLPQAGNLGGGGFALWVPADGAAVTLDFRERSPAAFRAELYLDDDGEVVSSRSLDTPLAVGVPGSPAGLYELHQRFGSGRFTFKELVSPAIRLAGEGFQVDAWLARSLRSQWEKNTRMTRDPSARRLFFPDGMPLLAGTHLRQPELKRTLEAFAEAGPKVFYEGPLGTAILEALEAADRRFHGVSAGHMMTPADLMDYEVKVRRPLAGWFRGHEVLSMGPPSSGGLALLQILGILEGFPLAGADALDSDGSLDSPAGDVHTWIEAMRCSFADRAQHLGDPDYYDVPLEELLSPGWIGERRVALGDQADLSVQPKVVLPKESDETTHLSVVDRQGNAVSLTTTLNASFGSGILVPQGGFLLNNELDDFSIKPGTPNLFGLVGTDANQLMGGKRPLSSMTPTVIRDGAGQVRIVIGAAGGPRIITSVTQVVLRVLGYGQGLQAAMHAPRLHQQWIPQTTRMEPGWNGELLLDLEGHHQQPLVLDSRWGMGAVQAIYVSPEGNVDGVSDPRWGGAAGIEGRGVSTPLRPLD